MRPAGKRSNNNNFKQKRFNFIKKEDKPFDVEKWIKQNSNREYPKRGKKNRLGEDKKNKRKH